MDVSRVEVDSFGRNTQNEIVKRFTLISGNTNKLQVINYGPTITSLQVPDRDGKLVDVTLGFDDLKGYLNCDLYFGGIIGRVANRIAKGRFTLDDKQYQLSVNNGPNHLHGGIKGFDKKIWDAVVCGNIVKFTYFSQDGEEGYPGDLTAEVNFRLREINEIEIQFKAQTTKATPVNLTNHSYFNLSGQESNKVYDHEVTINADTYLPTDESHIPTGEIKVVDDSDFDFRLPVLLGKRMNKMSLDGFDHTFCYKGNNEKHLLASAYSPVTGICLEVFSTQPSIHFYTGNFISHLKGKNNVYYEKHSGFCLEAQNYPDSVNHVNFPNSILKPGETYSHTTWLKFSIK